MDHCITSFGKRMFRIWLCHPLRRIDEIEDRLNSVDDLISNQEFSGRNFHSFLFFFFPFFFFFLLIYLFNR